MILTAPFFFNHTATTEIYTLSLHDALPICSTSTPNLTLRSLRNLTQSDLLLANLPALDRKSTRLNSSHQIISYAVFCLKKKRRVRAPFRSSHLKGIPGVHAIDHRETRPTNG